jgi:hypothetical protein
MNVDMEESRTCRFPLTRFCRHNTSRDSLHKGLY